MSLNITFDGRTYDKDTNIGNSSIYYQGYFYKGQTASSASKWNNVRSCEASGYFNINLGDADWLTQDGVALSDARVVIVFWKGDPNRLADCGLLTEWGAFELILGGGSFYTHDAQIKDNMAPNLVWYDNIPTHAYVNTTYSVTNNSNDIHSWVFNGVASAGSVTMWHWDTRWGQNISSINKVESTDYDWGNGETTLGLAGSANSTYSWDSSGTYSVGIEISDYCDDTTSDTVEIKTYWHAPSPNIARCTSGGTTQGNTITTPDTPVYFKYVGTDVDGTITSIDWVINDSGAYGNTTTSATTGANDIASHTEGEGTSWLNHTATPGAFTNPGTHTVEVTVNWFDGHENQTTVYTENFTQSKFRTPSALDLVCNEAVNNTVSVPSTVVSFNYTGSDVDNRITGIDWTIDDGSTDTVINDVPKGTTVEHTEGLGASWYGNLSTPGAFTNSGSHSVGIVINWNDGWDDNTVTHSEIIVQGKFSGPTVRFIQEPVPAPVGSGISFTNTSINTSRVGLGLPNHVEYSWTWTDATGVASITDTPFSYEFEKIPTSAAAQVSLCAEWSDGWDTKTTCISEDVVFETTVTVTPEDCYYSINVVGTSSDGTVNNYGWTVSSGITEEGPWNLVWESPIGIDQQQKTLCFSTTGWYKVTGFVYGTGTTTSDYDTLLITETCPDSASIYNIWNGTGILDVEADWLRSGAGEESTASKYRGTNGLDVSYDKDNESIYFYRNNALDMDSNDYDFLSFWINIKSWNSKKDVVIRLYSTNYSYGVDVNLSSYIDIASLGPWTKVMIPLSNFKLTPQTDKEGWPTYINKLRFKMEGDISFWLDNVALTMGSLVTVPICNPDPDVYNIGEMGMTAELITPAPMKSEDLSLIPGPKASKKDIGTITPKVKVYSPFPKPINL